MLLPMVKDKVQHLDVLIPTFPSLGLCLSPSPGPGIQAGRETAPTAGKEVDKSWILSSPTQTVEVVAVVRQHQSICLVTVLLAACRSFSR